jgi:nucleoside-diphosphate-sugar epimerase
MRTLVTGAAGVIGFELVRRLLERGGDVLALDQGRKGGLEDLERLRERHPGRLSLVRAELGTEILREHARGPFDAVAHLAAIVGVRYVCDHPYETLSVNVRSTLDVCDHALREGCKVFLFASSSENYASGVDAGQIPVPTPEDVPLSIADIALPRWSYAASKIAGEAALFGAAPLGSFVPLVARFHNVYGPRMGPTHVIPELIERCRRRADPFPVFGPEQTRSFLYVDDAARALCILLEAALAGTALGGIYNVGSPVETRIEDLARLVLAACGHEARIEARPAPPGSVGRRVPDVSKLARLGFQPAVSLEQGVRACWEAQRAAPEPPRR